MNAILYIQRPPLIKAMRCTLETSNLVYCGTIVEAVEIISNENIWSIISIEIQQFRRIILHYTEVFAFREYSCFHVGFVPRAFVSFTFQWSQTIHNRKKNLSFLWWRSWLFASMSHRIQCCWPLRMKCWSHVERIHPGLCLGEELQFKENSSTINPCIV